MRCTDTGFSVIYENLEGGTDAGHQRVWTDNGSTVRYRTLAPGASLTAVSSDAAVPEGEARGDPVHSINNDMDGAFDVMVARTPQGRGDPCLWHATTVAIARS